MDKKEVSITFRWDTSRFSNGVILGYKLKYWSSDQNSVIDLTCKAADKEYVASKMNENTVYYFKVQLIFRDIA